MLGGHLEDPAHGGELRPAAAYGTNVTHWLHICSRSVSFAANA